MTNPPKGLPAGLEADWHELMRDGIEYVRNRIDDGEIEALYRGLAAATVRAESAEQRIAELERRLRDIAGLSQMADTNDVAELHAALTEIDECCMDALAETEPPETKQ